jgi:hypothetical protein
MEEVVLEDPGEDGKFPECPVCYDALNRNSAAACVHSIVTHPQAVETLFPIRLRNWHLAKSFFLSFV